MAEYPTDEDLQIARLKVHRDLVGWVIQTLEQAGIPSVRTRGNDENGDIRLLHRSDIVLAKQCLRQVYSELSGEVLNLEAISGKGVYIEIKAYSGTVITSGLARQLIGKGTILGVVTTTTITKPARELLNQADIAWIDRFPERLLHPEYH
jgi:hypothetical protein